MSTLRAMRALGPIDARQVARDPLMRWLIFYPILIAAICRWGAPPLAAFLSRKYGLDLTSYYPLLMAFVLVSTPMMAGTVIGFLLLDQRDDGTVSALMVTPLTAATYLAYRITIPMLLSGAVTLVVFPLAGLIQIGILPLLAATFCAAPVAPFYALFLAAFARNKVQGFAFTKAMGVLMIPPVAAWFLDSPWHWLMGVTPLFWPAKVLWMLHGGQSEWWMVMLAGLAFQALPLTALLRRYVRVIAAP